MPRVADLFIQMPLFEFGDRIFLASRYDCGIWFRSNSQVPVSK